MPLGKGIRAEPVIVARVRPGTSKGITDLLLPHWLALIGRCSSKKLRKGTRPSGRPESRPHRPSPVLFKPKGVSFVSGIDQTDHSTN